MLRDILIVCLVLWVISAILPVRNGQPFVAVGGAPSLGYLVAAILVIFLVLDFLVPALRGI